MIKVTKTEYGTISVGKPWVGLTDEEVRFIVRGNTDVWCENPETDPYGVAEMVEAKLKEKNNG